MSATYTDEDDALDNMTAAAAAAPAGDLPEWVKEGTQEDDDDIAGENISAAKPMEKFDEWIEAAKGVEFEVVKAVIETNTPKDKNDWKYKQMNVHLKVKNGIVYKQGDKPKFKGKIFFHRFYVAVNRAAEKAGEYDFSKNAKGKDTTFWEPSGGAWGEYNEFLKALGFPNDGTQRNNKEFRDALVGRSIIYDIDKDKKEEYDAKTDKRHKVAGEFVNVLRHARPAKAAAATASPAAAAAATDTADWDKES